MEVLSSSSNGGGDGLMGDPVVTSDKAAADEAADEGENEESATPYSADISLDTPKSYMSATGSIRRF